jgi:hypothetical protein
MKTYTVGARVFMDWIFSGKPTGKVLEVIEPGAGNCSGNGRIRVRLDDGREVEGDAYTVVPNAQVLPQRGCFIRLSTDYKYALPPAETKSNDRGR